jgi:chaperonin cofactor prefoldin
MKSNIGQTGVASIRIKGQRVEDLPLGLGNQAKEQLADAIETERLNAIAEINAQYPHQRVDYLSARINECEENKNRMRKMIAETRNRIQEYQALIIGCGVRDKTLQALEDEPKYLRTGSEYREQRKAIFDAWGHWDKASLEQQVEQDKEAIERFEDVIHQEDESIKEHSEVISLCRERDKKLAKLGAKADGS